MTASSPLEAIAKAIGQHRFHYDLTIAAHACSCGEWRDSGPGAKRVRHNYEEHLADSLVAALELREEAVTAPVWVLNDPPEMDDQFVNPMPKQHIEWIPKRRWVSSWTSGSEG